MPYQGLSHLLGTQYQILLLYIKNVTCQGFLAPDFQLDALCSQASFTILSNRKKAFVSGQEMGPSCG